MIEFDWLLVAALSCIALAGVTRGIVGFGAGMIIVTSLAIIYDPITGVIMLALLDIPSAIQLGPSIYRHTIKESNFYSSFIGTTFHTSRGLGVERI